MTTLPFQHKTKKMCSKSKERRPCQQNGERHPDRTNLNRDLKESDISEEFWGKGFLEGWMNTEAGFSRKSETVERQTAACTRPEQRKIE